MAVLIFKTYHMCCADTNILPFSFFIPHFALCILHSKPEVFQMQDIIVYLRAGDVVATVVDEYNQTAKEYPTITRGVRAQLCLRILSADGTSFPVESLNYDSWDFVLAHDWLSSTPVQIRMQTNISVTSVTVGEKNYSQINIPLLETNTVELVAVLASSPSIKLGAELAGFETGHTDPGFLIQFDMNVRNRRGTSGTDTPTPVVNGTYTITQINDLLAEKADADHTHPAPELVIEEFTLTPENITSKQIVLANTPSDKEALTLTIIGGLEQHENLDFTLMDKTVSWNGLPLENELSEGDVLRVKYFKAVENP